MDQFKMERELLSKEEKKKENTMNMMKKKV